ncbi:Ribonuclease BN family enzyme [Halanaeroarchaeum sp. HSR-CO]|uniref:YihY/virulence factor BrkB family protein n=1 Tax=Halanaeroarchaeum sp. HSR-CO TaxID=2866382 RepID=UPI00217D90E2|nr:YihY/virulence factor BrkB family protein [Halanaeroarchaeum sp. HSR-CO]UWG48921.1 Ribonuclease BN family enzyme [Halanaeroarchaeum sp. HSR-CO]
MSRQESSWPTLRETANAVHRNQIGFLAAAVAYYGFLSVIPLLLLSISVGTALGYDVSSEVLGLVGDMVTPAGAAALANAVDASGPGGGITVVGVAVLLWSSLRVFRGLDVAFSSIYGDEMAEPLLSQLGDALLVVAVISVSVAGVLLLGVVLSVLDLGSVALIVGPAALTVGLALAFLPIFYIFPDADVSLREALPGTVLTAVGWTALATTFGIYAQFVPSFRLYGVLGAALLLVTWLYLGGVIIMVGAVVNAVLAGRIGEDAESIDDEDEPRADPAPDVAAIGREVRELRESLDEKTVSKDDLEHDLQRYVRRKLRRGKARGWGPYLVLLYGTLMTLGAFYWLEGGWAILAMIVVWLSTLGLYVLMVLFGVGFAAASAPGSVLDWLRERRS